MGFFRDFFGPGLRGLLNYEGLPSFEEFTDFKGRMGFEGLTAFEKLTEEEGS